MCLGIPGQIVQITQREHKLAMVDVLGVRREINIACIVDAQHPVDGCIGDWVLVHVGFAMSRIDEREARLTLEVLQMLGEAQSTIESMREADAALARGAGASSVAPAPANASATASASGPASASVSATASAPASGLVAT